MVIQATWLYSDIPVPGHFPAFEVSDPFAYTDKENWDLFG